MDGLLGLPRREGHGPAQNLIVGAAGCCHIHRRIGDRDGFGRRLRQRQDKPHVGQVLVAFGGRIILDRDRRQRRGRWINVIVDDRAGRCPIKDRRSVRRGQLQGDRLGQLVEVVADNGHCHGLFGFPRREGQRSHSRHIVIVRLGRTVQGRIAHTDRFLRCRRQPDREHQRHRRPRALDHSGIRHR